VRDQVRLAPREADDLQRLFDFLAGHDLSAAKDTRVAIGKAFEFFTDLSIRLPQGGTGSAFITWW